MSSRNPWSVDNINDFWFLTCPECAFKTKAQHKFQSHAIQNHPQSSELFDDNSKEFEEKLNQIESARSNILKMCYNMTWDFIKQ